MSSSENAKGKQQQCKISSAIREKKQFLFHSLFGKKKDTTTTSREEETRPVVIIVGGGYGGVRCAKDLDATGLYRVVLLDRKDYFLNNIAGVPAAVQEEYADGMCVPYDQMRTKINGGTVLQAEVAEIHRDHVLIQGFPDEPLHFDFCVIATGSNYAFPFKVPYCSQDLALEHFRAVPELIAKAQHVVVAGGGAVGCDMAGEIATCHPGKKVTLVHSREKLLPGDIKDELRDKTLACLHDKLKVNVILGERLTEGLDSNLSPENDKDGNLTNTDNQTFLHGKRKLRTNNGTELEADLVFLCWGASVNSACVQNNTDFEKCVVEVGPEKGRVKVDPKTLLVADTSTIFAIGDVSSLESKMACYTGEQGSYVAKKLIALGRGMDDPGDYWGHPNPAMMVPLGGKEGYMQLPNPGGKIIGRPIAALGKNHLIKSWALVVRPAFSFQCPFSQKSESQASEDREKLAKALGVTTQEAALKVIQRGAFRIQEQS